VRSKMRTCACSRCYAVLAPIFAVGILLLAKRQAGYLVGDVSIKVHVEGATKEPACTNGWASGAKRKVFDLFAINSEIDVLMARLHELNGTVDRFVVIEAPYTFSGLSKPLHFKDAELRWKPFANKITHLVAPPFTAPAGWSEAALAVMRKVVQKNLLADGLRMAGAADDDLVIVSDLDEIPHHQVIEQLRRCSGWTSPVEIESVYFFYDFGCKKRDPSLMETLKSGKWTSWRRSKVVYARELEVECDGAWDGQVCVDELRDDQQLGLGLFRFPTGIRHGGLHLSYFMGFEMIQQKLKSISHIERAPLAEQVDYLQCRIAKCEHPDQLEVGDRRHVHPGFPWMHAQKTSTYKLYYERPLNFSACVEARLAR